MMRKPKNVTKIDAKTKKHIVALRFKLLLTQAQISNEKSIKLNHYKGYE